MRARIFREFGVAVGVPSAFWYFGGLDPEYLKKAGSEGRLSTRFGAITHRYLRQS
jgi:hypothetical protein